MQLLTWVTSILLFVEFFDTTILYVCSVPIAKEFNVPATAITQPVMSYIIGTCLFIPLISWLIKRVDRYTIIHLTIIAFAISSLLCGVSRSLVVFSIARFIQGAAISIAGSALIITLIDVHRKTSLIKLMAMINILALAGAGMGPLLGAIITHYLTWRIAFLINLPVCLLSTILLYIYSQLDGVAIGDVNKFARFDYIGYLLLAGFLFCASYGLEQLARDVNLKNIQYLLAGILLLLAYIIYWYRSKKPALLALNAFADTNFAYGFMINVIVRVSVSGFPILMGIYLQQGMGLSVIQAGIYLSIVAAASIVAKCLSTWINNTGIHRSITICSIIASIIMLMMRDMNMWMSLHLLWLPFACYGLIVSMLYTAMNSVCFVTIHRELIPDASNIVTIMQQFCIGLGVLLAVGGYHYLSKPIFSGMSARMVANHVLYGYHLINITLVLCMFCAAFLSFLANASGHLNKINHKSLSLTEESC